jgi:hypothetical protein
VLDNGKSLLVALRENISENSDAEARDHVKRFHELFFTLEPDKEYIEKNVKEALVPGRQVGHGAVPVV